MTRFSFLIWVAMPIQIAMTAVGVPLTGLEINDRNPSDITETRITSNDSLTNFLEFQILSAFDTPLQQNINNGGDYTNDGHQSLHINDVSAIQSDGNEQSVRSIKVNYVDPLCEMFYFTEFENPFLRADVGSKKVVSKTLGPFPDSVKNCGGRVFSVIGKCLSLAEQDDNTVVISLNANDEIECQTPGVFQGRFIINFDQLNNGESIINFNYALDCNPDLDLVGFDAMDYEYIIGGPDLLINLGIWISKLDCGGHFQPNLKHLDQTSGDWFNFDQISQQLHVFGHPQNFEGESFEFIFEAQQVGNVIASSVFHINLVKKSSIFFQSVASKYLALTRHERKLLDCSSAGGNTMIAPIIPNPISIIEHFTYVIGTIPAFGDTFSGSSNPPTCGSRTCFSDSFPDVVWDQATQLFTLWQISSSILFLKQVTVTCTLTSDPGVTTQSIFWIQNTSCLQNNILTPVEYPFQSIQFFTQPSPYVIGTIPAFMDTVSGITNPPTCGARTCRSDNPNIIWNQDSQLFTIQSLGALDVVGQTQYQLSCILTDYQTDNYYDPFVSTIVIDDPCQTGNAMTLPTLPSLSISQTYFSTTIPAFGDTYSGSSNPATCGLRTCASDNPNVVWDNISQLFTVQTLGASDVVGTYTVTLTCTLNDYSVSAGSQVFTLTIPECTTGNSMTVPTLPSLSISQTLVSTTIYAFGDTISGSSNPLICGLRTCTSDNSNVVWDNISQLFIVKTLGAQSVAETRTVKLACSLTGYPTVPAASQTFELKILAATCATGNVMTVPKLPILSISQTYVSSTILAFNDTVSGSSNPPTCGPRTCTSNNPNVPWDDGTQLFTVKTRGALDVAGTYTVILTCSLTNYPKVTGVSQTFSLIITKSCVTGNSIIVPTLPDVTVDQYYVPKTIPAFRDTISGTTNPPNCGLRTCTSNNLNVVWDYFDQLFTVKTRGEFDVVGTHTVRLTCSLINYPSVNESSQTFSLIIKKFCVTGNSMIVPNLPDVAVDQYYVPTTIPAFSDTMSGLTNPPTCGLRTCTSNNLNVVWDNSTQAFTVISRGELDVAETPTVTLNCLLKDFPALPSVSSKFVMFKQGHIPNAKLDALGKFEQGYAFKRPSFVISKIDNFGQFNLQFSEPMNLEAFSFTKKDRNLKARSGGASNGAHSGSYYGAQAGSSQRAHTNQSKAEEQNEGMYLLSDQHLSLSIFSENNTAAEFSWQALNITSTNIVIQLQFKDPLYISKTGDILDKLIITILPPALEYFKSLATGALIDYPLRTEVRSIPTQVLTGVAIQMVQAASQVIVYIGLAAIILNIFVQIALSSAMSQMWSMVNSQQIILSFMLLNLPMPGNVILVMTNFANIAGFNVFPTDAIMNFLFNLTPTDSPGVGFESMGDDNKSLVLYLGMSFLIMLFIGLQYLVYAFSYCCRHYDRLLNQIEQKLRDGLVFGAVLTMMIESYFDFAVGSQLRFEQNEFQTGSDYFDFGFAILGTLMVFALPLSCFLFLRKNVSILDQEEFRQKYGGLYEGYATHNAVKRYACLKMMAWFLLRRLITALNLVQMRDQTIMLQLIFNMWLCVLDLCIKHDLSPYESIVGGFMEKFNDTIVVICSYFPLLFTNLIETQEDQYLIGWYYLAVNTFLLGANIFVVGMSACQTLKKKIDQMQRLRRHQQLTEKQNKKREAQKQAMMKVKSSQIDRQVIFSGKSSMDYRLADFESINNQELYEYSLALKRVGRKEAREEAKAKKLLGTVDKQLKQIPEVTELSESQIQDRGVSQNGSIQDSSLSYATKIPKLPQKKLTIEDELPSAVTVRELMRVQSDSNIHKNSNAEIIRKDDMANLGSLKKAYGVQKNPLQNNAGLKQGIELPAIYHSKQTMAKTLKENQNKPAGNQVLPSTSREDQSIGELTFAKVEEEKESSLKESSVYLQQLQAVRSYNDLCLKFSQLYSEAKLSKESGITGQSKAYQPSQVNQFVDVKTKKGIKSYPYPDLMIDDINKSAPR